MAATMPKLHGRTADDDDGPSGEELAEVLGRIATAFLCRERGWDRVHARRLLDRLVADGWLVSMRRG